VGELWDVAFERLDSDGDGVVGESDLLACLQVLRVM
jgi:Ca2+-binding EF-hand superfamily protein